MSPQKFSWGFAPRPLHFQFPLPFRCKYISILLYLYCSKEHCRRLNPRKTCGRRAMQHASKWEYFEHVLGNHFLPPLLNEPQHATDTESSFPNVDRMTGSRPNPKSPVFPYKECLIANCSLTKLFYQSRTWLKFHSEAESSVITNGVTWK